MPYFIQELRDFMPDVVIWLVIRPLIK